jgi:hypothetical protein
MEERSDKDLIAGQLSGLRRGLRDPTGGTTVLHAVEIPAVLLLFSCFAVIALALYPPRQAASLF